MKKPKELAQLTVKIDKDIARAFKNMVLLRYGTNYGMTSFCVEKALSDWIIKSKKKTSKGDKK